MQTQDASSDLLIKLWPWFEANKKNLIIGLVAVGLAVGIFSYVSAQRAENEKQAGAALTKLLTGGMPGANAAQMATALAKVATDFPGTAAAQRAQLQAGATLFSDGQYADAQLKFQNFLDANNAGGALAATAQLGIATCLEALGKPEAMAAYQKVVNSFADTTSAEVAKQSLARLTPKAPVATPKS